MTYRPPGSTVENIPNQDTLQTQQPAKIAAIIGDGVTTKTVTEAVYRQHNDVSTVDGLSQVALSIVRVGNNYDSKDYLPNVDYTLNNGEIDWAPTGSEPVAVGKLAAGTYYYVVQPKRATATAYTGPASPEWEVVVPTSTGKVVLDWTSVADAESYEVFRGTASGVYERLAIVTGFTTFTDDGSAVPTVGSPAPATDTTKITEITSAAVNPGTVYYVTYTYAKLDSDYDPEILTPDALYAKHGEPNTANTLSLAASFAFANGAESILALQVKKAGATPTTDEFKTAIDKLRLYEVDHFVVLSTDDIVINYAINHVKTMSNSVNKKERQYAGALAKGTSKSGLINKALGVNNELAVILAPTKIVANVKNANTGKYEDVELSLNYAAAGLIGGAVSRHVAEPWTRKTLSGFKNLVDSLEPSEMNELGAAGVCVLTQDTPKSPIFVRHGLTTNTSGDIDKAEIATVQIKHDLQKGLRMNIDPVFVGSRQTKDTGSSIAGKAKVFLGTKKDEGTILDMQDPVVSQSAVDPRLFTLKVRVLPARAVNWIDISYQLLV